MSNSANVRVTASLPDLCSFKRLRAQTGWGVPDDNTLSRALRNSLFGATATASDQTVGMLRVVGDGALNFYLQDVIVDERFRRQSIGRHLVNTAIQWVQNTATPDATIGLMAAEGQVRFYEAFGFTARPGPGFGPGMQSQLTDLHYIR